MRENICHVVMYAENFIYEGEEYLENNGGDLVHLECIQGIKWLIDWLGYEIKEFGGK